MCEKHYVKIYLQLSSNPNKKRIFPQNLNVWILKMVGPENLLEKNKKNEKGMIFCRNSPIYYLCAFSVPYFI